MVIKINFKKTNELIEKFEKSIKNPQIDKSKKLYTGIDLGTAFIVLAVIDEDKNPVCGAYEFANVIKDGMVVDYIGACDIVKKLKKEIEDKIGVELFDAGVAIPPNTESIDGGVVKNVAEAAGFNVCEVFDEPTAANKILNLQDGAVVDIGGGTTGISILKNGKVIKVVDEATGGTHFSLVLSGSNKISFEDAELLKRDFKRHKEIFPILKPVIDKIISIINRAIDGTDVNEIILVGGSALLENIESYIEENIKIKTLKPKNPMFVIPLGIAIGIAKKGE
ncbi:ethanolamine utilization protein EutJ [Peptoniphilus sp. MSJ-1]|uniref:Ethanolamine utilization protein EutJ n=1 Tax=Peptoniphilus ovalis TaxID=2841503 RepID=A0ABS6FFA2_9FIRM|nr:ethanolamine utilization protein EutJ [Peptoniphilus ovalis]MBU5668830.1 ethanolamine utilization protein EutJ [Peptoniphilus ovalis]